MISHPIDSVPEDTSIPVHKDSSIPENGRVPLGNIPTTSIETKYPASNDNIEVPPVTPGLGLMEGMFRCKVCKQFVKQSDMDMHRQKHNVEIMSRDSPSINSENRSEQESAQGYKKDMNDGNDLHISNDQIDDSSTIQSDQNVFVKPTSHDHDMNERFLS